MRLENGRNELQKCVLVLLYKKRTTSLIYNVPKQVAVLLSLTDEIMPIIMAAWVKEQTAPPDEQAKK